MLTLLRKKKLTEDKVANIFVNGMLDLVEDGWPLIAELINEDPEFEHSPQLSSEASDQFLLIVVAGNINYIPNYFTDYQDVRLIDRIMAKMAYALGLEKEVLQEAVMKMRKLIAQVNHPSKNTRYGMSKAIFHRYQLNEFQQEYFRNMKAPNPIFLKKLDDVIANFIWNWEGLLDKYRVVG